MKVLHVVEALMSGVAVVVEDYIRNTPEIEHHVLGWRRPGSRISDNLDELVGVIPMVEGHRDRIQQVASVARSLQPDLIHAQSSFAGLYSRAGTAASRFPVVYTPHCYAFERADIGAAARLAFRTAEALMHPRTACVAAGSPREADLARRFRPSRPVVYVPYVVPQPPPPGRRPAGSPLRAVTVGRLTPAKDPDFLAAAAASPAGRQLRWTWIVIPGGEDHYPARLVEAGVEVIGLSQAETLRRFELGAYDAYVHTAAWECAPLTLLEASAYGLPVVARRIPALEALGVAALHDTPEDLARGIAAVAEPARMAELVASSLDLAANHTPERQREALGRAYRLAVGERADAEAAAAGVQRS